MWQQARPLLHGTKNLPANCGYIGIPLPKPLGNTGVMLCLWLLLEYLDSCIKSMIEVSMTMVLLPCVFQLYLIIHTYINSRRFPMGVGRNRTPSAYDPYILLLPRPRSYIWSYKHAGYEYCAPDLPEEHTITPVFPEGLGRCVPMYPQFAGMFRSHVIGGEPIAINRAQIQTPSCYWEFHRKTQ